MADELVTLAEHAATSQRRESPVRCIVFCDSARMQTTWKSNPATRRWRQEEGHPAIEVDTEFLVGGRRVFEREQASNRLKELGFIAGSNVTRARPAFVFATSAGEVGIDLDADHMVSDLVAWERMVQRLGRVNRRGDGEANVIVVVEPEPTPKKAAREALAKDPSDRNEKESNRDSRGISREARSLRKPFELLLSKHDPADVTPVRFAP
jgi:CRISPR-associated endonuclease/helicase Cas3